MGNKLFYRDETTRDLEIQFVSNSLIWNEDSEELTNPADIADADWGDTKKDMANIVTDDSTDTRLRSVQVPAIPAGGGVIWVEFFIFLSDAIPSAIHLASGGYWWDGTNIVAPPVTNSSGSLPELSTVASRVALSPIVIQPSVFTNTILNIIAGDDYAEDADTQITVTLEDYTGPTFDETWLVIRQANEGANDIESEGSADMVGDNMVLTFEMTKEQTGILTAKTGTYQFLRIDTDGNYTTLRSGVVKITQRIPLTA